MAGFASVAAVLRRPLTPFQPWKFLLILFLGFGQVVASVTPIWLASLGMAGPALWRSASAIALAGSAFLSISLGYIPLRALGASGGNLMVINWPATYCIYGLGACTFILLLVNAWVVPEPGLGLYYAALLAGLAAVFVTFADVVVRDDEEPS